MGSHNGKAFFAPHVDIEESDKSYVIKADIPGVKKDDIHVTLEDGVLTLEAQRTEEKSAEESGKIIRKERRFGKFSRSFTVGRNITVEDIKGNFADGVLTVTVAKASAQAPARKRVEISQESLRRAMVGQCTRRCSSSLPQRNMFQ
jgi:HSP20 family protein